jgi:selenocysteine lyase/cysteine desulfurase
MWTLVQRSTEDGRAAVRIQRSRRGRERSQVITSDLDHQRGMFPAERLAVDGATVYVSIEGTGIVTHRLSPDGPCS